MTTLGRLGRSSQGAFIAKLSFAWPLPEAAGGFFALERITEFIKYNNINILF
jgi:hypothetical protein